jgi:hypothetical protein
MIDRELEKLPEELDSLLEAERAAPGPSDTVRSAIRARVDATILAPVSVAAAPSLVTVIIAALAGSGVAIVAAYWAVTTPDPPRPPPAVVEQPAVVAEPEPTRPPAVVEEPKPQKVVKKPIEAPDTLDAERAILEEARAALGRNDPTGAFEALDRHRTRYASGQLAEEREGLRIVTLVRAQRFEAARASAAEFKRKYPRSLFQETIDASLASIP